MPKTKTRTRKPQVLTQAVAGEHIAFTTDGGTETGGQIVQPYHPTEPSYRAGHWYCVTHGKHFENQFQKDTHINEGAHELAWICHEHDCVEQPTSTPSTVPEA